mmetsp:Transcript_6590/g.10122  ORF Transcript_6590/g.10122 Transcript_6590/m.10122 type:complete len:151 (+) Transcript_6590:1749-2201(+)
MKALIERSKRLKVMRFCEDVERNAEDVGHDRSGQDKPYNDSFDAFPLMEFIQNRRHAHQSDDHWRPHPELPLFPTLRQVDSYRKHLVQASSEVHENVVVVPIPILRCDLERSQEHNENRKYDYQRPIDQVEPQGPMDPAVRPKSTHCFRR